MILQSFPYHESWNRMNYLETCFFHEEDFEELFNLRSLAIAQSFRTQIMIKYPNGYTLELLGILPDTMFPKIIIDSYFEAYWETLNEKLNAGDLYKLNR